MNSTNNRVCYFTVSLKVTTCLRIYRVFLRCTQRWSENRMIIFRAAVLCAALSGSCGSLLIRLLLLRWGKMALGIWHLVPSLKHWLLLAGMLFCCNLCTLFLSVFLLNTIRQLLCIWGLLQALYIDKVLGKSFCKNTFVPTNWKLLDNVYVFSNFLRSPVFLALINMSPELCGISSCLHYKSKISILSNCIFIQHLTSWAHDTLKASRCNNYRDILLGNFSFFPQSILFQSTVHRDILLKGSIYWNQCHAVLIKH